MFINTSDTDKLIQSILNMDLEDDQILFIMLGEKSSIDIQRLIKALNESQKDFMGGIFPGIIYDEQKYEEGAIITRLPSLERPLVITGLDTGNIQLPDLKKIIAKFDQKYAAMILVDGFSRNISGFLSLLFNNLAGSVNYFGGGAGSLSFKQQPCIFTSEGLFQDAAIISFVKLKCRLGVRHGWKRIIGPVVATKTDKNIIIELNWKKAFDVYKEIVERDSGKKITKDNFFNISKGYPFGMLKEYAETVARTPVAVNDAGALICIGEVPENSVLDILKGEVASLVNAAGQAADDCKIYEGKKVTHGFVVDCISRVLFLEDNFSLELQAVKTKFQSIEPRLVPIGMLSLGEISSCGNGFLDFLNKTIVAGILYE
ncbi:MAG: hypothetical protein GXZ07_00220 [Firmicutes bacterium]|nr:hypothetical protein [Bacillota bacterium]